MANAVYPKYMEAVIQASASVGLAGSTTTGVFAVLVDTGVYTYSAAHQFYSSISSAIVGTEQELGTKTFTNGLFDAADSVFPAVTGNSVEAIVLFVKNAGANTTWRLLSYIDTGVTGLPATPNGGNINVAWNASGIIQF